ncbi:programmed cell death 6-interacting protein isoform X2 [Nasonia vitripennis]|uniref:BRO1 domain-containing protein n=1 Tax=Nasonia vitripennis TaxID=7425 RepID=A0A7M7Q9W1_NASVI|nr:programmed cell death 6-interacting protein isoform X2 [Nasonia vitripennis]
MTEFISVPLKKPSDVDITKPLHNVIKSTYSTASNQKDYLECIIDLGKLRKNALWRAFEKYESSLEVIYRYYDQICVLESKIPANEVQIPFKWKDAFDRSIFGGKLSLTISSLAYEKVCVLFNIAALQSSVASTQSLESDEGLKTAAKLFQQSAGIFNYLKGNIMLAIQQEPTPDMSPETLEALSLMMLAQAQEIFTHKAIHDKMKDNIIAKLAAQTEELFSETFKLFQKEIFRAFWDKEWIPLITGKQLGYRGMSEYYQSLVCKNNKQIGEEIARLEFAAEMFKVAQTKSNRLTLFEDYYNKTLQNLTEVKRDNDFIYHERIPDFKSLSPVSKAHVAKLLPLPEKFSSQFQDIFADLLPMVVHNAISNYESRKSDLVNCEIAKLRNLRQLLNGTLASLNLPAAIEDLSGTELPQSLIDKATFIHEAGGIKTLEKTMNELPELLQRNKDILDEAERMLSEEEDSDNHLRLQFKERWTRLPSGRLTEQFKINSQKYRGIINNAISADKSKHMEFSKEQSSSGSSREQMLCKLALAYDAFKEIKNNLQEGVKFYNDLTQLLIIFQNKVSDFCFARKTEKEEILKDLTSNLSQTDASDSLHIPSHHKDKARIQVSSYLPYPTHDQGMPIPYGVQTSAPYPNYMPPPLPTTFNPYATMAFPTQDFNMPFFTIEFANSSGSCFFKADSLDDIITGTREKLELPNADYKVVLEDKKTKVDDDFIEYASQNPKEIMKLFMMTHDESHNINNNTKDKESIAPSDEAQTSTLNSTATSSKQLNLQSGVWNKVCPDLMDKILKGEMIEFTEKQQIVKKIAKYMVYLKDTKRGTAQKIAEIICKTYPRTFADKIEGVEWNDGIATLRTSILNCANYKTGTKKRKANMDNDEDENEVRRRERDNPRNQDEYGCTQYAPDLPSDENIKSQEERRLKLIDLIALTCNVIV